MAETAEELPTRCPECGAPSVDGMTCWEQLGAILAWEWDDPELQAEHFLTVASYNLQHPAQFTSHALDKLRIAYIQHLDDGLPVAEIRRRFALANKGDMRILRPKAERRPTLHSWAMTIADVYLPDHPEGAAQRVRDWAAAIRDEIS